MTETARDEIVQLADRFALWNDSSRWLLPSDVSS